MRSHLLLCAKFLSGEFLEIFYNAEPNQRFPHPSALGNSAEQLSHLRNACVIAVPEHSGTCATVKTFQTAVNGLTLAVSMISAKRAHLRWVWDLENAMLLLIVTLQHNLVSSHTTRHPGMREPCTTTL